MPTTTLEAFTVRESAMEPVAMVRVVEGEVRTTGVAEVKSSSAAWAGRVATRIKPAAVAREERKMNRIARTFPLRSEIPHGSL